MAALSSMRRLLSFPNALIDQPLFKVFSTLDELLQAAGKRLEHFVYHSSLVEKGADQTLEKPPFLPFQTACKVSTEDGAERVLQVRVLFGIGQESPKRIEGSSRVAPGDHVDPSKQTLQNTSTAIAILHDLFANPRMSPSKCSRTR